MLTIGYSFCWEAIFPEQIIILKDRIDGTLVIKIIECVPAHNPAAIVKYISIHPVVDPGIQKGIKIPVYGTVKFMHDGEITTAVSNRGGCGCRPRKIVLC